MENILNRPIMNVSIALNQGYYQYAYVLLKSLYENNKHCEIHVYVLNENLEEEYIDGFKELSSEYGNVIYDVKMTDYIETLSKIVIYYERFSKEVYFRLAMTEIIPKDVDRILYLDVDTLVNGDIYSIYSEDFGNYQLKAVKETTSFDVGDERNAMFEKLFSEGYVYFNAGVLLMNLKSLREEGYGFKTYIDKLYALKDEGYKVAYLDQDILNLLHHDRVEYIEPGNFVDTNRYCLFSRYAWNKGFTYEDVKEYARIVHYCGFKPWNGDGMHYDVELLWWDYAKQTIYYMDLLEQYLYKTMTDMTIFKTYIDRELRIKRLNTQIEELKRK